VPAFTTWHVPAQAITLTYSGMILIYTLTIADQHTTSKLTIAHIDVDRNMRTGSGLQPRRQHKIMCGLVTRGISAIQRHDENLSDEKTCLHALVQRSRTCFSSLLALEFTPICAVCQQLLSFSFALQACVRKHETSSRFCAWPSSKLAA
jgi:hypothetical protein